MTGPAYVRVPIAQLRPDPKNIRRNLGDLDELTASICQNGVLQPLVIRRPSSGMSTIIDGHRRFAASKAAGLAAVPCLISEAQGDQTTVTMLAAAMHKQLEPLELARAFQDLIERGLAIADIAHRSGYSKSTISSRLLLLELPTEAQQQVRTHAMTLAEGVSLARQIRGGRQGIARLGRRTPWFTRDHHVYDVARSSCTLDHGDQRVTYWGICGPCWEDAIREDAIAGARVSA
jgi:ParB family chromosome partitioning protein